MAELCKVQTARSEQPVEGPGHSNVAVPGVEVISTELAMKVGSWGPQIFISALIA